jgi:hypothetical protein
MDEEYGSLTETASRHCEWKRLERKANASAKNGFYAELFFWNRLVLSVDSDNFNLIRHGFTMQRDFHLHIHYQPGQSDLQMYHERDDSYGR